LTEATYLMIVGYSFPDTDSNAQRLLDAFASENPVKHQVHIVMGSDVNAPAVQRVVSLVKSSANGRKIIVSSDPLNLNTTGGEVLNIVAHPLFTQDFIGRHAEVRTAFPEGEI